MYINIYKSLSLRNDIQRFSDNIKVPVNQRSSQLPFRSSGKISIWSSVFTVKAN